MSQSIQEIFVQQEIDARAAREHEERRLKRPPFDTMVKDLASETLDELRGWREPPEAYILWERPYFDNKNRIWRKGLFTLGIHRRPEQREKLAFYERKGFRIIHYGKFPSPTHLDPAVQQLYHMHTDGQSRKNSYQELENEIKRLMGKASVPADELSELRRKAAAYDKQKEKDAEKKNGRAGSEGAKVSDSAKDQTATPSS